MNQVLLYSPSLHADHALSIIRTARPSRRTEAAAWIAVADQFLTYGTTLSSSLRDLC